jgi:acetyl-CoA carboxylase biotin carboxylase subunit
LAENAKFVEICAASGIKFIGPGTEAMQKMGDKATARKTVARAGVPVVPGSEGTISDEKTAKALADKIGYPIAIKATAGGGGKGLRVAWDRDEFITLMRTARAEAEAAFGNPEVYFEKYIEEPRHIEVQILADSFGNVIHLGERDCSIQRRHQKLVEESPSPVIDERTRRKLGEAAVRAAKAVNYVSAGTIEFLFDKHGKFYFMEMNTRVQVEHPVTEMVTNIDIIKEQIAIAAGAKLALKQGEVKFQGHAIECRINAEHPSTFRPSPGLITYFHPPGGLGVRVDSAAFQGYRIPPHYDSLIGKLIVHGRTRNECLMRLRRALDEFVVDGIDTTLPLFRTLVRNADVQNGQYDIHWLESFLAREEAAGVEPRR